MRTSEAVARATGPLRETGFARRFEALLRTGDSPRRTAAAFAVGVFFGFSPFLGLQATLALLIAFALNLNRVSVLLGVASNLPWILPAYYAVATAVGAGLIGAPLSADLGKDLLSLFDRHEAEAHFWRGSVALRLLFWPYVLGATLGAAGLALVAYRGALTVVTARRPEPRAQDPFQIR